MVSVEKFHASISFMDSGFLLKIGIKDLLSWNNFFRYYLHLGPTFWNGPVYVGLKYYLGLWQQTAVHFGEGTA